MLREQPALLSLFVRICKGSNQPLSNQLIPGRRVVRPDRVCVAKLSVGHSFEMAVLYVFAFTASHHTRPELNTVCDQIDIGTKNHHPNSHHF